MIFFATWFFAQKYLFSSIASYVLNVRLFLSFPKLCLLWFYLYYSIYYEFICKCINIVHEASLMPSVVNLLACKRIYLLPQVTSPHEIWYANDQQNFLYPLGRVKTGLSLCKRRFYWMKAKFAWPRYLPALLVGY